MSYTQETRNTGEVREVAQTTNVLVKGKISCVENVKASFDCKGVCCFVFSFVVFLVVFSFLFCVRPHNTKIKSNTGL